MMASVRNLIVRTLELLQLLNIFDELCVIVSSINLIDRIAQILQISNILLDFTECMFSFH